MRLLVVTNLFYPDRGGGASVFSDLCFGLAKRGWDVTVLCTYPYYPEWRKTPFWKNWHLHEETVNGVRVLRHWIYVPSQSPGLVRRVLCEISFGLSLLRSLLRGGRHDAVLAFCPMLSALLFTALRKMILREAVWINIQDLPADAASAAGISKSGVFDFVAQWTQKFLFSRGDVLSTISPLMMQRIAVRQRNGQALVLCPNWLNGTLAERIGELPPKLGRFPAATARLLYAGNIGRKQGLLETCEMLARSRGNFHFKIHGNGGEASKVSEWIKQSNDERFEFGEFLDEGGFARALHDADWFVITEKPGSGASFMPSKLIPGIASGTPILAVCDQSGPLGHEVLEADLGLLVEWNDLGRLPELLDRINRDGNVYASLQRNCLDRAKMYDSQTSVDRWDQLLRDMSMKSSVILRNGEQ